ncbi:MAG: CDP-glycerol glycerophosphotransferase family protein, partial [Actinomadura sp.]
MSRKISPKVSPKISIIVPFHNVEAYIEECLESLAGQTLRDLEVIMVDDGSPDSSAVIAKAYVDRDPRFTLIQQENQGLGPARNTGVRAATGKYLAFVDSDDVVVSDAYERLVSSLEETGSDLACGAVRKLSSAGVRPSPMHEKVFGRPVRRTHVSRHPVLLGDRTAWNKVFRRTFWDAHDFRFPPGVYEDAPVTIPAHVLASAVDVLGEVVYHWREREGSEPSITQRRTEKGNLEGRVRSIRTVVGFLRDRSAELCRGYLSSVLAGELPLFIDLAAEGDEGYADRLCTLVDEVLDDVDDDLLAALPALKRLKYHLIRRRMPLELIELLDIERRGLPGCGIVRRGRLRPRWYARYPYFRDAARAIPDRVYDVTDELRLWAHVDEAGWRDGRLRIEGRAYIGRLDMSDPASTRLRVWLRDARTGREIDLPVERTERPDVTENSRQGAVSYDWSGFAVDVDVGRFEVAGEWRQAMWELHAEVRAPGIRRRGPVGGPRRGEAKWLRGRQPADGVEVRPVAAAKNRFVIQVKQVRAKSVRVGVAAGALEIRGWSVGGGAAELVVSGDRGGARLRAPVTLGPEQDGLCDFVARVPLDELLAVAGADAARRTTWSVLLEVEGRDRPLRLAVTDDVDVRHALGPGELVVTQTAYGNLRIVTRPCGLTVTGAGWTDDGRLLLTGDSAGADTGSRQVVLCRQGGGGRHAVPVRWTPEGFQVELAPARISRFGAELPLSGGQWDLVDSAGVPVVTSRALRDALPEPRAIGHHEFRPGLRQGDALRLTVRTALDAGERGRYAQELIRRRDYPHYLRAPLRDLVVFDSFRGRQYSDSPRAIYEELRRRSADLEYVWVSRDGQFPAPDGARTVLYESREHYQAVAAAGHFVGNDIQPDWVRKRPGQFYLQTWHGTPLKRIGFDIDHPRFTGAHDYLCRFGADVGRWDALVSPNPFSTAILRRAFRYEGRIIEAGYPRNDLLAGARGDVAAAVRGRLGIAPWQRVVLYA